MKKQPIVDDLLGRPQLKKRGWTDGLIRRFLPEADGSRPNPHYRSAPPMLLYRLERVEAIEASAEFQEAKEKASRAQQTSQAGVATKQAKMRVWLDNVRIRVPCLSRDEVLRRAVNHYNARQCERWDDGRFASLDSDERFLERIAVNYLRHELSSYEAHLDATFGKVGARDAYVEIKTKVLRAIVEAYSWLASECQRQERQVRAE